MQSGVINSEMENNPAITLYTVYATILCLPFVVIGPYNRVDWWLKYTTPPPALMHVNYAFLLWMKDMRLVSTKTCTYITAMFFMRIKYSSLWSMLCFLGLIIVPTNQRVFILSAMVIILVPPLFDVAHLYRCRRRHHQRAKETNESNIETPPEQ